MTEDFDIPDDLAADPWRSTTGPVNRLSRIAARMTDVLDGLGEEARDVRGLVILNGEGGGATVLHGYEDVSDALTDAITFVDAFLKTSKRPSRIVIQPL